MAGRSFRLALASVAVALVAAPGASAATKEVTVGPPARPPGTPRQADFDQFFRSTVTIHAGDSVRWRFRGFHTVSFVPAGQPAPPFVVPQLGAPVTGVRDSAGRPFWFNGMPNLEVNPHVAFRSPGDTFDGTSFRNSGLPLPRPTPYTLRFPNQGTFRYVCLIHPGMSGRVRVVAPGTPIPAAARDRAAARAQLSRDVRTARRLERFRPARHTVAVGHDARTVVLLQFLPGVERVRVGSTVTFAMSRGSAETHTVTFGPERLRESLERNFISPVPNAAGPPTLRLEPRAGYPSDPPPRLPPYTGRNHGDGFLNSGILDAAAASPPPARTRVRFTRPGVYHYECVIHPNMDGTIVVTRARRAPRRAPHFTG